MTQPQKGLCAEPNLHAQYLLLNVIDDDSQAVRAKLSRVLDIFEHFYGVNASFSPNALFFNRN